MKRFNVWLMPERKVKGNYDKWEEQDIVKATSRKQLAKDLDNKHKNGTWKIRAAV